MKRIVFAGSKPIGYECFQYLLEHKNKFDIEIIGLLTKNREEFKGKHDLKLLAKKHMVKIYSELDEILALDDFEILISVQYHELFKKKHISKVKEIAINLHMAPLPEYRGSNQFSFAIINKDTIFGTTIHKIKENVDSGPILFEERFNIDPMISVDELYDITYKKSLKLFKEKIQKIIEGNYNVVDQTSFYSKRKKSFHKRKDINEIKKINIRWDEEKIDRHLRAASMPGFEPPYTYIQGKKVYLVTKNLYKEMKKNANTTC